MVNLVLKEYGDPNIVYVLDNSQFLLEVISDSNCYSLMERQQAVNANLLQIPLREEQSVYTSLIVNEAGDGRFFGDKKFGCNDVAGRRYRFLI